VIYPQHIDYCPAHVITQYVFVKFFKYVIGAKKLEKPKCLYFITSSETAEKLLRQVCSCLRYGWVLLISAELMLHMYAQEKK